jgi:hypothetical protein
MPYQPPVYGDSCSCCEDCCEHCESLRGGACRVCGCADDRACEQGCWWVEADLCSACDGAGREAGR